MKETKFRSMIRGLIYESLLRDDEFDDPSTRPQPDGQPEEQPDNKKSIDNAVKATTKILLAKKKEGHVTKPIDRNEVLRMLLHGYQIQEKSQAKVSRKILELLFARAEQLTLAANKSVPTTEVSTSAAAGAYNTPKAFERKPKKRKK